MVDTLCSQGDQEDSIKVSQVLCESPAFDPSIHPILLPVLTLLLCVCGFSPPLLTAPTGAAPSYRSGVVHSQQNMTMT